MRRYTCLLGLLVGGCVAPHITTDFVPTNGSTRPMRAKSPTQVSITSVPPARPFAEVGFIEGRSEYSYKPPGEVVATMRATAAAYGCDALMITGPNNTVSGWRSTHTNAG